MAFSNQASLLTQVCGLIDPVVSLQIGQEMIKGLLLGSWLHGSGVMECLFSHTCLPFCISVCVWTCR